MLGGKYPHNDSRRKKLASSTDGAKESEPWDPNSKELGTPAEELLGAKISGAQGRKRESKGNRKD